MPVAIDLGLGDFLPKELLELANKVRAESQGLPERVICRRVRDALDAAKWRKGPIAAGGIAEAAKHTIESLEG
jgi:hypothetical protein